MPQHRHPNGGVSLPGLHSSSQKAAALAPSRRHRLLLLHLLTHSRHQCSSPQVLFFSQLQAALGADRRPANALRNFLLLLF